MLGRGGQARDVLGDLVERRAAIPATEREGEARARRGEGLEPERLEDAPGADVPRVGDDERVALVEGAERDALVGLACLIGVGHGSVP
jgi:hypothetical protein